MMKMLVFSYWTLTALAVDRSKFRTCQQTGFCRRQRHFTGGGPYEYVLLPESIQVHEDKDEKIKDEVPKKEEKEGVWNSLSKRILGSSKDTDIKQNGPLDPYLRGPNPQITGKIVQQHVNEGQWMLRFWIRFGVVHHHGLADQSGLG